LLLRVAQHLAWLLCCDYIEQLVLATDLCNLGVLLIDELFKNLVLQSVLRIFIVNSRIIIIASNLVSILCRLVSCLLLVLLKQVVCHLVCHTAAAFFTAEAQGDESLLKLFYLLGRCTVNLVLGLV